MVVTTAWWELEPEEEEETAISGDTISGGVTGE